jgi:hypothetical protein
VLANRKAFREMATGIIDFTEAQIANGVSVDDANLAYQDQRSKLISLLKDFGLTTAAAQAYADQLGLTPDLVATVVDLVGDERARAELEAYIAQIGDIPTAWRTRIEALIDQGAYQYAQSLLRNLTAPRSMTVQPIILGTRGRTGFTAQANAYGGYYEANNPMFGLIGEAPWDEAVLTVGNAANLRKQLEDDRIRGPILDALPRVEVTRDGRRRTGSGGNVNVISYEQNPTPAGVATAIRMAGVS